jgi:hypothetical protein
MTALLDRTVGFLADKLDRRGFMGKAAVVGSAVVAAPLEFALRPRTAYAAVCNCNGSSCQCGSLCCDGYTEFCCTMTGRNTCPAGTITAGWWKVDGSQFCGGAARYYLDCNAQCGTCGCGANGVCDGACSGTRCGCAAGSCNNRKAGCTRFRYGQCNQGIRCVGPIVCRVVTCQPPWQFDPACGTSSRTDNATRNHDRPCLNEPHGNLDTVVEVTNGIRVTGWAVSSLDYSRVNVWIYVDGHRVADLPAAAARPDVQRAYPAFGLHTGFQTTLAVGPGRHDVCAYAVDRKTGRRTVIGFKQVNLIRPRGVIESVTDLGDGRIRVSGWALDPLVAPNRAQIRLRIGETNVVHRGLTNTERLDLAWFYPGQTRQGGFVLTLPSPPGSRSICLEGYDANRALTLLNCRSYTATGG